MAILIGTLTAPGATDTFLSGDLAGHSYVASATGVLATLTYLVSSATYTTLQLGVYADSAGAPGSRLAVSNTTSNTSAGNKVLTMTTSITLTNGVTYWLAVLPLGGQTVHNTVASGTYKGHVGETALQDPFGAVGFTVANTNAPILGESASADAIPTFQSIPFMPAIGTF